MAKSLVGGLGPTILGVVWTEATVGTILVWRADFLWIVLALITGLLGSAIVTTGVTKGLGNHTRLMSFTQLFEAVSIIALLLDVQAIQAAGDFILALWPISIVWNLQASRKVKIAFCLLMAIGILPAIAVTCRIVSLPSISSSTDPTHDFGGFMLWAVTEVWLVIILGSIPPLRPLFLRVFYGIHPHSSGNRASAPTYEMGTGNNTNHRSGLRSQVIKPTPEAHVGDLDNISEDGSENGLTPGNNGILVVNAYSVEDEGRASYPRNKRESTDVEAIRHLMKD
ncbi:hypothetical protein KVT40_001456 [Elsinoe batatas]|uniref:Rhodopsin domain-containing protein n=1 Tax=Elsinoe batatas TaxID=2601811 RepID=A0A8K0PIT1_9PEZI|nr:hypothetical protein KVT40_001456 [Elsinoe batatas]